jgi:hypothetical protein
MLVELSTDPRADPPPRGDERATLAGFLRWQRETLELKCSGLDDAALARRSAEPSTMSLLGLVRHLADVERGWFRGLMAGQDVPPHFSSETDPDADFDGAVPDPAVVSAYELTCRIRYGSACRARAGLCGWSAGLVSPVVWPPAVGDR